MNVTDKKYLDQYSKLIGNKVSDLKPDGLIAVNKDAGGHAGKLSSKELIARLKSISNLPIISAGGVGNGQQFLEKLDEGACGISIGSPFIATKESPVSMEYKKACVHYSGTAISPPPAASATGSNAPAKLPG